MALADEVDALAYRMSSASLRVQWGHKIAQYRDLTRAYQACFLDDEGNLTDAGALVLENLSAVAGIGRVRRGRNAEEIQFDEGARRVLMHLLGAMHLDREHLARMARKLRENRSNG